MPLKHATETFLVILLGAVIVVTGLFLSVLSALPVRYLLWSIAFGAAVFYPLLLYPLFRRRRADKEFRLLHFAPAAMLVAWLVLDLLSQVSVAFGTVGAWYAWAGGLVPVLVLFALLIMFCLRVIRQRRSRLLGLAFLMVPFLVLGLGFSSLQGIPSTLQQGGEQVLASIRSWIPGGDTNGPSTGTGPNLTASNDYEEELLRMRMRRMERRNARLAERGLDGSSSVALEPSSSSDVPLLAQASSRSQDSSTDASVSVSYRDGQSSSAGVTPPPSLTSSGGGLAGMGVLLLAGYTTVLHRRAKKLINS